MSRREGLKNKSASPCRPALPTTTNRREFSKPLCTNQLFVFGTPFCYSIHAWGVLAIRCVMGIGKNMLVLIGF